MTHLKRKIIQSHGEYAPTLFPFSKPEQKDFALQEKFLSQKVEAEHRASLHTLATALSPLALGLSRGCGSYLHKTLIQRIHVVH